jgi:hypothetical protein
MVLGLGHVGLGVRVVIGYWDGVGSEPILPQLFEEDEDDPYEVREDKGRDGGVEQNGQVTGIPLLVKPD